MFCFCDAFAYYVTMTTQGQGKTFIYHTLKLLILFFVYGVKSGECESVKYPQWNEVINWFFLLNGKITLSFKFWMVRFNIIQEKKT